MKTIRFLFFGLLVSFFAVSTANAQTVKEEFHGTWERTMVECDGDFLIGPFAGIQLTHFNKNGDVNWIKSELKAEVVSVSTGEVFKVIQFTNRVFIEKPGNKAYFTFHQNIAGDMGTHYQIAVTWEIDPAGNWTVVKEKANCF